MNALDFIVASAREKVARLEAYIEELSVADDVDNAELIFVHDVGERERDRQCGCRAGPDVSAQLGARGGWCAWSWWCTPRGPSLSLCLRSSLL